MVGMAPRMGIIGDGAGLFVEGTLKSTQLKTLLMRSEFIGHHGHLLHVKKIKARSAGA
jgi:hypothetical protein